MKATAHNIEQYLNTNHADFFQNTDKEYMFFGSKGAGKSYSVADKLLLQPLFQKVKLKIVVIRKTLTALKKTCIELVEERADLLKIPYKLNRTDYVAKLPYKSQILYFGLDDSQAYKKLQSITDVDLIWFEELPEITERDYENALLILRGGHGKFKQAISTFNPIGRTSWVYDRLWVRNINDATKRKTTVEENPFINKEYIDTLKALKHSNMNLYRVYYLGEWGQLEGVIYDNYDIVDSLPEKIDEVIYGLDFGYNNPSALLKIYLSDNEAWLEEKLYQTKLTNSDLIDKLKVLDIKSNDIIYCDSAEPQRIEEICRAGFNAKPSDKSVQDGIDFCKSLKIHILSNSTNMIKEEQSYSWKEDKNGKPMDEPVKFQDHLEDAKRYALYTHLKHGIPIIKPSNISMAQMGL